MKRILIIGLALVAVSALIGACDQPPQNDNQESMISDQIGEVAWVTLPPTDTQDPASIGTQAVFMYPYSIEDLIGVELGPWVDAGDWSIATPDYPNFTINETYLHECDGTVYMVIKVTNNGPYYFQYISLGISHGTDWTGVTHDEDPWVWNGIACPVESAPRSTSLAPGVSLWIYQEVHPNPAYDEYNIHLTMCAHLDAPTPCQYRYRLHTEAWPTQTPSLWLLRYHLRIFELVLCWVGPGPGYEVVNSIPKDTEVELLGVGEDPDYLIIQEPKYQRPCWVEKRFADGVPPDEELEKMEVYMIPLLPSPTVVNGSVTGRVFRDSDRSGGYTKGDEVFPGTRVSLAPGSCRNPGQAMTTTTNNNGRFTFSNVSPGTYCLTSVLPGSCKVLNPGNYDLTVPEGINVERNFVCQ